MECRYVLFSPVGTTDPISNYHDGAMLHIARKYKPEKVCIYLSREMMELHNMDDRYRESLRLLGEKVGQVFDVELFERPELSCVHKFDFFYIEFEKIIGDIARANPGCTVLLNVSSGTPAMKGALQTLAALYGEPFLPVQVSTPAAAANPRRDNFRESALKAAWELDEDNQDRYTDRCDVSTTLNLSMRLKKDILAHHVEAGDYHAALAVARGIAQYVPADAVKLLEAANARVLLDASGVTKALAGTGYRIIPIEESSLRDMSEYLLWLALKEGRAEYPDFIRGVTPLIADLFELYIEKRLSIRLRNYASYRDIQNNILILRKDRMERDECGRNILEALDVAFNGYDEKPCSSAHMLAIIGSRGKVPDALDKLRSIEEVCRNIAAHEIVSVTADWVRRKCGMTPDDILKLLFDAADMCGIARNRIKDSYQKMNAAIIDAFGCQL